MSALIIRFDDDNVLGQLAEVLGNHPERYVEILREIAIQLRSFNAQMFLDQGARFGGWLKMSPITMLFRRKGRSTAKVSNWSEAVSVANSLPVLQDTGKLRDSLCEIGASGAVEKIDGLSVLVGSSLDYADEIQRGGRIAIVWDAEHAARFRDRVDFGSPGNWNAWAFAMMNAIRREAGVTNISRKGDGYRNVPARRILIDNLTFDEWEDIRIIVQEGLNYIVAQINARRHAPQSEAA